MNAKRVIVITGSIALQAIAAVITAISCTATCYVIYVNFSWLSFIGSITAVLLGTLVFYWAGEIREVLKS